jgi:hypothetical protein
MQQSKLPSGNASGGDSSNTNMLKSEERAYNLIKKIFNSSANKKAMVSNSAGIEPSPFVDSAPDPNQLQHVITMKPPAKKSVFTTGGNYQPEEEVDNYESSEESFEDADNKKYDILKSNKYLLYFSSKQDFLAQEFYDQSCKRTVGHMKIMLGAFTLVYMFQTLIIISVRNYITHYLVILLIKGCIALIMVFNLFWLKSFYKSVFMKFLLFLLSLATLVLAVVQGYNSLVKELNTVQSIELVLLFAFVSYFP